jgi:hypothetical protein
MGIKDAAVMQQGPPSTPPPATSAAAGSVFRVLYMIYSSYLSGKTHTCNAPDMAQSCLPTAIFSRMCILQRKSHVTAWQGFTLCRRQQYHKAYARCLAGPVSLLVPRHTRDALFQVQSRFWHGFQSTQIPKALAIACACQAVVFVLFLQLGMVTCCIP